MEVMPQLNSFFPVAALQNLKNDIAFVGPENPQVVLSFLELKRHMDEKALIEQALLQAICYLVCPLAYCRWGRLRMKESLKTLVVTPTCVYRLTFSKPATHPFGLNMKIEETKDLIMMEWILSEHVGCFIHECKTGVAQNAISSQDVDFVHWTPFNLSFGDIQRVTLNREPNLGFVFKTKGEFVVMHNRTRASRASTCQGVEPDMPIYVKYNSALLDVNHQDAVLYIRMLLSAEDKHNFTASDAFPVKHPYVGILSMDIPTDMGHPLLITNDISKSLAELLSYDSLRMKWKVAAMRKAFFSVVGISALNLVYLVGLCHNDIRPTDILAKDDSFCLIDFGMSRSFFVNQKRSVVFLYQIISSGWVDTGEMMVFTVAQIAVTVFILSANKKYTVDGRRSAVLRMSAKSSIWNTERNSSHIDVAFPKWALSKGPLVFVITLLLQHYYVSLHHSLLHIITVFVITLLLHYYYILLHHSSLHIITVFVITLLLHHYYLLLHPHY